MKERNYTSIWPKKRMGCAPAARGDVGWWVGVCATQALRRGLVGARRKRREVGWWGRDATDQPKSVI